MQMHNMVGCRPEWKCTLHSEVFVLWRNGMPHSLWWKRKIVERTYAFGALFFALPLPLLLLLALTLFLTFGEALALALDLSFSLDFELVFELVFVALDCDDLSLALALTFGFAASDPTDSFDSSTATPPANLLLGFSVLLDMVLIFETSSGK